MKNKNKLMIVILAFLVACSSDNNAQDDPPDMSANDATLGKDIAENDIKDADEALNATDQDASKVCEAIPPALIFRPGRNLEELVGCEITLSQIQFVDYRETKITGLNSLREMGPKATLFFHRNSNLVDVDTFSNLELVKDDFEILNAPLLADLTGFKKLRRVEGLLSLKFMTIKNFNGLQSLEHVGEFNVSLAELESLEGFENLTEIKGNISFSAPKISEAQFREFLKGKTIGGDIRFQGVPFIR